MISLYSMLWVSAAFFGMIGVMRGLRREMLAFAGVVVATLVLYQLDTVLRGTLLASISHDQAFFFQLAIFTAVVYFGYRTRSFGLPDPQTSPNRGNRFQDALLGGLLGALNGYMIWGAVWYFMDINEYPFSPLITAPALGSVSAQNIGAIPLLMVGGLTGGNDFLLLAVVLIVFVAVLFAI